MKKHRNNTSRKYVSSSQISCLEKTADRQESFKTLINLELFNY